MFLLLMRVRLFSAKNVVRDTLQRHPLVSVGLALAGLALFGLVYGGFLLFFQFARQLNVLTETVTQIFYFLFLFLLAGAVPFVASTLLQAGDYGLLFASPLAPRAVVAAKLLDATVTNSLQFTVLGIPAIVACASAVGVSGIQWLLVPPLVVLFVLLPALLTALGLLLALAALGMARLRAAITLLNAVMAIGVCATIVVEAGQLPLKPSGLGASLLTLRPTLAPPSASAHLSPSGWFATALLALAGTPPRGGQNGLTAWVEIFVLVGALYAACIFLGGRLLSAASVEEGDETGRIGGTGDSARGWRRIFGAPVAAILVKDFKYLRRDNVLLSQLTMPLILFLVPFLLSFQDSSVPFHDEMYPFAVLMTGVILFMQTSILSLSSIGLEGRSFWLLRTAPRSGLTLLWAKFLLSALVSIASGLILSLFSALVFRVGWAVAFWQAVLVIIVSGALCGLGVGISAAFPRFVYENPAHRVSAWALILGFFATTGYLTVSGLLFGLTWYLGSQPEWRAQSFLIYGLGVGLFLALTVVSIVFPMALGARRLETYQWEH